VPTATETVPATTQTSPLLGDARPVVANGPAVVELCPSGTFGGLYATQISIKHVSCQEAYALIGELNNNDNNFTDAAGKWWCDITGAPDYKDVGCALTAGVPPVPLHRGCQLRDSGRLVGAGVGQAGALMAEAPDEFMTVAAVAAILKLNQQDRIENSKHDASCCPARTRRRADRRGRELGAG
jgi:hypothetical protein